MLDLISQRLEDIRSRITAAALRSGGQDVELVAVSKTVPVEYIQEAIDAGITLFGENRVQEAKEKWKALKNPARCHLIGHLQTNKVKDAVRIFERIHSVDSLRLAEEINRRCMSFSKIMPVLVQVKVSPEETKSGIEMEKVAELIREIRKLDNLRLDGLMTIPPYFTDPEDSRPYFHRLVECRNELENQGYGPLPELSMGMSNDFEVAIEEGATFVRVGSALFGERAK